MVKKGILVGLGNIGLLYDYVVDDRIITHSSAIDKCKNLQLLYSVDTNHINRKRFYKKYKIPAYAKLIPSKKKIDFITVATNSEKHYEILKYIIKNLNVKLIIIEKPFCMNLNEAKKILKSAKGKKIKIFVNYIRSFDSTWIKIKKILQNHKIFGLINYYKDEKVNGSHFIHLCMILFGNIYSVKKIDHLNFELYFKNAIIKFKRSYRRSKTSILLKGNNLEILDNNKFKIKILRSKARYIENEMKNYQLNVYKKIFNSNINLLIKKNLQYSINVHEVIHKINGKNK